MPQSDLAPHVRAGSARSGKILAKPRRIVGVERVEPAFLHADFDRIMPGKLGEPAIEEREPTVRGGAEQQMGHGVGEVRRLG